MTEQNDAGSPFSADHPEPSDEEILEGALSDEELELIELDLSEDPIAAEIGIVADGDDLSAEEAAIHVIET